LSLFGKVFYKIVFFGAKGVRIAMNKTLKEALAEQDVERILLQAASHADFTIRRYIWRGHRPKGSSETQVMAGQNSR